MGESGSTEHPRGWQRRVIALHLIATLLASGLLSIHFFQQPLRPWPDQGWMLQAAIRHARGQGLTTEMDSRSSDLTRPAFERLVYFPPGYPLFISAMLRTGLDVETAVKIVNAAALVLGMAGWLLLAIPLLEGRLLRILYSALLVLACGGILFKGGTTDAIFWAGVPWWISCLARARLENGRTRIALLAIAAVINSALISVRWAAAFLVPVAILALMIPLRREARELMQKALAMLVVALPPTVTYLAIGAVNRHYASAASVLSFTKPGWRPRYLLTLYPLESLFAIPVGVEPLLDRVWRAIDPAMNDLQGVVLFHVALPLFLMTALVVAASRLRLAEALPRRSASVLLVIVLVAAGLVAFLAWMALRYNWDFVDWSFLSEPRYYRPFLPAFLLGWLLLLDRRNAIPRRWLAGVALLALSSLYLLQAAARSERSLLREHDESLELVARVRSLSALPGLNVVFDTDVSDYVLHPETNLIANSYPPESELSRVHLGRPATLWLVRRVHETTAYVLDRDADRRRFETLKGQFHATRVWISSGGSYEIYGAQAGPP